MRLAVWNREQAIRPARLDSGRPDSRDESMSLDEHSDSQSGIEPTIGAEPSADAATRPKASATPNAEFKPANGLQESPVLRISELSPSERKSLMSGDKAVWLENHAFTEHLAKEMSENPTESTPEWNRLSDFIEHYIDTDHEVAVWREWVRLRSRTPREREILEKQAADEELTFDNVFPRQRLKMLRAFVIAKQIPLPPETASESPHPAELHDTQLGTEAAESSGSRDKKGERSPKKRRKVEDVIRDAERHLTRNPWPGLNVLARHLKCGAATLSKACDRSAMLAKYKSDYESRSKSVSSRTAGVIVDGSVGASEPVDLDDLTRRLIEECETDEERSRINAMSRHEIAELAGVAYTEPETGKSRKSLNQ